MPLPAAAGPPDVRADSTARAPATRRAAEEAFRQGRYPEAADLFTDHADRNPTDQWARYMLGLALWKAGRPDAAEEHLSQAAAMDAGHVKARLNLSRVLIEIGQPADAVEHAAAAAELAPSSAEAKRVLGRALAESGDRSGALARYEDALWINPDDSWSLNNMAHILIEHGRHDEAVGPLALAVRLDSANAIFWNNLGAALEGAGHLAAALAAYRSAVGIDPESKAAASALRLSGRVAPQSAPEVDLGDLAGAFREELLTGSSSRSDTAAILFPGAGPSWRGAERPLRRLD